MGVAEYNDHDDDDEGSLNGPDIEMPMNSSGRLSLQQYLNNSTSRVSNGTRSIDGGVSGDLKSLGDDKSYFSHTSHETSNNAELLAIKETKAVRRLRIVVLLVFLCVATVVCYFSYRFASSNEYSDFNKAFVDQATRVIDAFQTNAQKRVGAIENFASSITSHGKYTNSTWPNVTFPDFERRGVAASELADVISIVLAPFVSDDTRSQWEQYSVENQGWFQESLEVSNSNSRERQRQLQRNLNEIPEEIYRFDDVQQTATAEEGPGPFLPQWQLAPIVPVTALVNFNLLSHEGYQNSLDAVLESQVVIVGKSFDISDPNDEAAADRKDVLDVFLQNWDGIEFQDDPITDLHVPVFDNFDIMESNRQLVGLLTCVVYWRTYFTNVLSDSTNGIIVVLANTCGQEYTYQINGVNADYVGPGDRHNPVYNKYGIGTEEGIYLEGDKEKRDTPGSCLYSLRVYPSEEFESAYTTNSPIIYTVVLVCIFLFTSAVFLLYDCLVERRQRVVMDTAVASSAIVSSLFPKVVRDRIVDGDNKKKDSNKKPNGMDGAGFVPRNKKRLSLRDYVSEVEAGFESCPSDLNGKPIAELFDDCTVLFADIAGFTSWSSGRAPSDVFALLETLYGNFDKIARKRRVFKVETIGDCYLAVTGLPEPQPNHVLIMCKFANECKAKMRYLLDHDLCYMFGDETKSLSMRFGLHSGAVTAGVLRGAKSRFQLFGDTVNTAARMESTGQRDKIQLSQDSADLLVDAGKGSWLSERADMIQAKGKGELQTYWLKVKSGRDISSPAKRIKTVSSDDSLTHITDFSLPNLEDEEQDLKDQESKHARYNNFAYCNSSNGCLSDGVDSFADIAEEDYEDDDENLLLHMEEQLKASIGTRDDVEAIDQ